MYFKEITTWFGIKQFITFYFHVRLALRKKSLNITITQYLIIYLCKSEDFQLRALHGLTLSLLCGISSARCQGVNSSCLITFNLIIWLYAIKSLSTLSHYTDFLHDHLSLTWSFRSFNIALITSVTVFIQLAGGHYSLSSELILCIMCLQ